MVFTNKEIPYFIQVDGCNNCKVHQVYIAEAGTFPEEGHPLNAECAHAGCDTYGHSVEKPFITPKDYIRIATDHALEVALNKANKTIARFSDFYDTEGNVLPWVARIISQKTREETSCPNVAPTSAEAGSDKSMREYARVDVSWPVILHTVEGLIDGELKNASIEGALIHCQRVVDSTEPLEVSIEIPGVVLPILATVEILRLNTYDSASLSCELAVRFLEMSADERRIFCAAVERQGRIPNPRSGAPKNTTIALKAELREVLEKLTIELGRSLNDALEEAIADLVRKYEHKPVRFGLEPDRDQRQSARAEVSWPVVVKTSSEAVKGEVKNISSIGALICTHQLPSLDLEQTVHLQIKIPEHSYIFSIPANLIRLDIYDRGRAFFRYGLAFRFLEVSKGNLVFPSNKVLP
jgi:hypothetical protein